jgi:pimeloyl-ACP methyl ester carboxylesterase
MDANKREDGLSPMMPLLLLPGLICDERIFATQLRAFPQAIAFPGYGSADSLAEMARLALKDAPSRFALLGHSMGARVALEIMRIAPERVTHLALASTGVHLPRTGEAEKRYALRDIGRSDGMAALVEAWLTPMFTPIHAQDEALIAPLRQMCIEAGLSTFEAQIAALLRRPEVESLLPEIQCPTLIAVGRDDRWSPPDQHADIAALVPHARFVVIEDAGHMLPAEAPDALNAEIADWLDQPVSTAQTLI